MRVDNYETKSVEIRFKPLNGTKFSIAENGDLIATCDVPYRADIYDHSQYICGSAEIMALEGTFFCAGTRYDSKFIISYIDTHEDKNGELFTSDKKLWIRQDDTAMVDEHTADVEKKAS